MKFKTLALAALLLMTAVFAIACGEDETTTESGDPVVTTTAAATTTAKKTTTKATTVTTTVATTAKREITFDIPSKLPDGKAYDATLIFDGTEETSSVTDATKGADKGTIYDIFTLANGNKVFAYHLKTTYAQASIEFAPYKFAGDETGILFYMDTSLVAATADDVNTTTYGPRFYIDATWYQAGSHSNSVNKQPTLAHNCVYTLLDGTAEWVKTENLDNCRATVGVGFKGWIYVPVDQLSYNGENAQMLADYIATYPGECELSRMMVYAGKTPIPAEGTAEVYFDNILVVKSK